MVTSKEKLTFNVGDTDNSDSVGSYIIGADGNVITDTTVGLKKGLDVNVISDINVTTSATPEELSYIDQYSDTVFYFGYAPIGSITSAAVWKITRLTISGTLVKTEYASSVSTYTQIWDNRTSLSYS